MILSDRSILKLIEEKELLIEPLDKNAIQCSSIDLKLGDNIAIYKNTEIIDVKNCLETESFEIKDFFLIKPKEFVLATTKEYIKLPNNITAFVEGRSSLGRLGLFIENAGWVDAGFEGQITLELYNANKYPIKIYKDMRVCQLVLAKLDTSPIKTYSGKYKGQKGATASRIFMDFDLK